MGDPLPISVLLLARDESAQLEALFPRLAFAREVVVVWDPRGDRAARDVAARAGARVIEHAFAGFGPQRQVALAACAQPWVLWLDADERPAGDFEAALRDALAPRPGSEPPAGPQGWRLRRRTWFLGRRIRFCGWGEEHLLRLFTRERASFDDAPVHERVRLEGSTGSLDATLEHHSYDSIATCVEKMRRYSSAGAERAWRAGRRAGPIDVLVRPPLRFVRQYLLQLGFLDGAHGVVLCGFAAAQVFLKYAELWQRTRLARRPGQA